MIQTNPHIRGNCPPYPMGLRNNKLSSSNSAMIHLV